MFIIKNQLVTSSLLSHLPGVIHAYSTKYFGDVRQKNNQKKITKALGLENRTLVQFRQVHGTKVCVFSKYSDTTADCDGMVSGSTTAITLGVRVADCVPLLFVDPNAKVIAAAHAGWRGTVGKIAQSVISGMRSLGAQPQDIWVGIGPRIGRCCYTVSRDRADAFRQTFGEDEKVVQYIDGQWYLDLGYSNVSQLVELGVPDTQIDCALLCTKCQADLFFSFRRDGVSNFAEQIGIIAFDGS